MSRKHANVSGLCSRDNAIKCPKERQEESCEIGLMNEMLRILQIMCPYQLLYILVS